MPTFQELLLNPSTDNFTRQVIHLVRSRERDPVDVCNDLAVLYESAVEEKDAQQEKI